MNTTGELGYFDWHCLDKRTGNPDHDTVPHYFTEPRQHGTSNNVTGSCATG